MESLWIGMQFPKHIKCIMLNFLIIFPIWMNCLFLFSLLTFIKFTNAKTLLPSDEKEDISTNGATVVTRYIGRRCVTTYVILMLRVYYFTRHATRHVTLVDARPKCTQREIQYIVSRTNKKCCLRSIKFKNCYVALSPGIGNLFIAKSHFSK